ncbi:hypothetical protein ZWY2020_022089 [Hordeum vulgare]|nr:hypothetical protein ZWY2020_022089 [Hordeum vulgare]
MVEATARSLDHVGHGRVGGRFWALADGSDDEDDKEDDLSPAMQPDMALLTPSDVICEAFQVGYSEEIVVGLVDAVIPQEDPARLGLKEVDRVEVARRVVHRRTATMVAWPWRGPLPKVSLPKPMLLDFFNSNSWRVVQKRKNKKRPAPAPVPMSDLVAVIREERTQHLKAILGRDGPHVTDTTLGSTGTGYTAQCGVQVGDLEPRDQLVSVVAID